LPGPVYKQVQAWMQQAKREDALAWKAERDGRTLAA
jgi:hypothetical protein